MQDENKIYVGNLEYTVTDGDLKALFEENGFQTTEVTVIKDKQTDRSKGFGFVKFASEADLNRAIETLDGHALKSRNIRVSRARKKTETSRFNNRRDGM